MRVERADGEFGRVIGEELRRLLNHHQAREGAPSSVTFAVTLNSDYQERVDRRQGTCYIANGGGPCWNYARVGTMNVQGTLRVRDVAGTVADEVTSSCELWGERTAQNEMPQSLDVHALAYGCAGELANDFVKAMTPPKAHATSTSPLERRSYEP